MPSSGLCPPACQCTSPPSSSRGCWSVPPHPARWSTVTGRSSCCWRASACVAARSLPLSLTTWTGGRGSCACALGSAAGIGSCRCRRRSGTHWRSISGTAGRPVHQGRRVFLTLTDPVQAFAQPAAVTKIVQRNLVRAGIPLGRLTGAHMLRHTAASRMVNRGASFKDIADVLGHRSLATTGIYHQLRGRHHLARAGPRLQTHRPLHHACRPHGQVSATPISPPRASRLSQVFDTPAGWLLAFKPSHQILASKTTRIIIPEPDRSPKILLLLTFFLDFLVLGLVHLLDG